MNNKVDDKLREISLKNDGEFNILMDIIYSNLFINGKPVPFIINRQQLVSISNALDRLFTRHLYDFYTFESDTVLFISILRNTKTKDPIIAKTIDYFINKLKIGNETRKILQDGFINVEHRL